MSAKPKLRELPDPVDGELRVWHIPQVPMQPYWVQVASPEEAIKVLDVLAHYDLFCLAHRVRGDYANAAGLSVYEAGEWIDWCHPETGDDIDTWAQAAKDGEE